MESSCFIIMPISDTEPYSSGHFKRVYDFIIKPACLEAGFTPMRSDEILNTNYIALDILKRILSCEMAICDLSSKNPNVFYELGIRQAFNLPVVLMKDLITTRVFDIQGIRDIEYDQNLRIDNVESTLKILSQTLSNTYETKEQEVNSLVSLLGVKAAQVGKTIEITNDTEIILESLKYISTRLSTIEQSMIETKTYKLAPNYAALVPAFEFDESRGGWKNLNREETNQLKAGDFVFHSKFGIGEIQKKEGSSINPVLTILFQFEGEKKVMINYSKLSLFVRTVPN